MHRTLTTPSGPTHALCRETLPLSQSALTETNAVATVVESLALSRPEVGFFLRSECRRRKTKDAHDED